MQAHFSKDQLLIGNLKSKLWSPKLNVQLHSLHFGDTLVAISDLENVIRMEIQ